MRLDCADVDYATQPHEAGLSRSDELVKVFGLAVLRRLSPFHSPYDVLRMFVAGALPSAAGLKACQLAIEPVLSAGLLTFRLYLMTFVECWLGFAIWFMVGFLPRLTWLAARSCFGLFPCVWLDNALSDHVTLRLLRPSASESLVNNQQLDLGAFTL